MLELTELIGTTQQNVSKHLGVLQRSGIVARRKQGNFAYYRIVDEGVFVALRGGLRQPAAAGRVAPRAGRGGERLMLELYQTEWCPASRRVRERLTELGLDYVVHQVPVEREARTALLAATRRRHDPGAAARGRRGRRRRGGNRGLPRRALR